ncbi:MAG TPA: polyprenyl synthetase family protein [Bacteroidales bacterium]|nr:polyprenyl synthetase family protein [Bacteroidales bacterium]
MSAITKIKQPIINDLKTFESAFTNALKTDNPILEGVHEYVLKTSGKQFRPILTLLAARLNGPINNTSIDAAISLELLHTASLIHDDVIDDTDERRGNAAIHTRWTNKIAILSGDYILSRSLTTAVKTDNLRILKAIANIGTQLSDGEILQLKNAEITDSSESDYFTIIRKKTALLFSTCTEVGALSTDMSDQGVEHVKLFGEYLGICFQIKDDIFDYYDNLELGKPTGNDIRDGKITLPLIYALQHSSGPMRDRVLSCIANQDYSLENVSMMTQFAHDHSGIDYAISKMDFFKMEAIKQLSNFKDGEIKNSMIACAEFAASRNV